MCVIILRFNRQIGVVPFSNLVLRHEQTWLPWWPNTPHQLSQVLQNICCWHTSAQHGHCSSEYKYIFTLSGLKDKKMNNKMLQQLLLYRGPQCQCYVVLEALMELRSKCVTWIYNRQKTHRSTYFLYEVFVERYCPCWCRIRTTWRTFLQVLPRVPTIGQLWTRDRESGSISTKIFHICLIPLLDLQEIQVTLLCFG